MVGTVPIILVWLATLWNSLSKAQRVIVTSGFAEVVRLCCIEATTEASLSASVADVLGQSSG